LRVFDVTVISSLILQKENIMSFVPWIARILVGLYYLMMGANHFMKMDMMAGYAGSKGVPSPKLAVAFSGLLLLFGGISILLWWNVTYGVYAIVLFFLGVTPKMHDFWKVEDPQAKMGEMTNFMKNMALLGSTLFLLFVSF